MNNGLPESQQRFGGGGPEVAEHGEDDLAPDFFYIPIHEKC